MDWKTFLAHIINSLAWPVATVFVIFLLKDKITDILLRLKKLKHKETEIEFTEGVTELRKLQESENNQTAQTEEYRAKFDFLSNLANISPRAAVLDAFRILETAAAKKVAKLNPSSHYTRSPLSLQKMLAANVLSKSELYQFNQLRELRNEAAHAEEFNVRGMTVEAYIDIALSLASKLEADIGMPN